MVRRVMSPVTAMLLPLANSVPRHSHSGVSLLPKMRIRMSGRSTIWQSIAPPRSKMQLSSDTICTPSNISAPSRFSASSPLGRRYYGTLLCAHNCAGDVGQIAFATARRRGKDEQQWGDIAGTTQYRGHQRGERNSPVQVCYEWKSAQQVLKQRQRGHSGLASSENGRQSKVPGRGIP